MFVCWQAVLYTIVLFLYTFAVCVCVPAGLSGGWWTGGGQVFGIASVDSAQFGDVFTSDWTFTMSYRNAQQAKASHVTYKLAASGETQFSFNSEYSPNTCVSCCLSFF